MGLLPKRAHTIGSDIFAQLTHKSNKQTDASRAPHLWLKFHRSSLLVTSLCSKCYEEVTIMLPGCCARRTSYEHVSDFQTISLAWVSTEHVATRPKLSLPTFDTATSSWGLRFADHLQGRHPVGNFCPQTTRAYPTTATTLYETCGTRLFQLL